MTITEMHYLVPKDGMAPEDNEDSAAAEPSRRRFAVSDGATESGFARVWSRLLVDHFVHQTEAGIGQWSLWLAAAQSQWNEELKDAEIPWYGEDQFRRGAFATFLAVVMEQPEGPIVRYRAEAVGDSCLFHLSGDQLIRAFPVTRADNFDLYPNLVGSRSPVDEIAEQRAATIDGEARDGDRMLLMSDALSQWVLGEAEENRSPWAEINQLVDLPYTDGQYESWIAELRQDRDLHNDDVVLMAIDVSTEPMVQQKTDE